MPLPVLSAPQVIKLAPNPVRIPRASTLLRQWEEEERRRLRAEKENTDAK